MRGRVRIILGVHKLLGCCTCLAGIIKLSFVVWSKQVSDRVAVALVAGPPIPNNTVHARVKLLAREEAESVADVNDSMSLPGLNPLPLTAPGRHYLKAPLVAEENSQGPQVCMLLVRELPWIAQERKDRVRRPVVEVSLEKMRVAL